MKKFEGTIFTECDLCWKKSTTVEECPICGLSACIACSYVMSFVCPVCGVDKKRAPTSYWVFKKMKEKIES